MSFRAAFCALIAASPDAGDAAVSGGAATFAAGRAAVVRVRCVAVAADSSASLVASAPVYQAMNAGAFATDHVAVSVDVAAFPAATLVGHVAAVVGVSTAGSGYAAMPNHAASGRHAPADVKRAGRGRPP